MTKRNDWMSTLRLQLLFSLVAFFFVGSAIQEAEALNCEFREELQPVRYRSATFTSPDARSSAWSEATMQKRPSVFHTALHVHDFQTGLRRIILRSELTGDGHLRGYKDELDAGAHDEYCPVDWSADSRFLLIDHMRGPQGSDHVAIAAWVFDRVTGKRQKINTSLLLREIERYRLRHNLRSDLYYLSPFGWESTMLHRIVFAASPAPGDQDDFGIWSVEINGNKPKILERQSSSYVPRRFGTIVKAAPLKKTD